MNLIDITSRELARETPLNLVRAPHEWASASSCVGQDGDIIGSCLRSVWYRKNSFTQTDKGGAPLHLRGEVGKSCERILIDKWKRAGILEGANIKFFVPEFNLSAEIDALVKDGANLHGVEVKSYYGYSAAVDLEGNQSKRGYPKPAQFIQAFIYLYALRDQVDEFSMFYVARDTCHMVQFQIGLAEIDGLVYPKIISRIGAPELSYRNDVENEVFKGITINGIKERFDLSNKYYNEFQVPPREFLIYWTDEMITQFRDTKKLSKSKADKWLKLRKKSITDRPGDFQCSYCNYRSRCYREFLIDPNFNWGNADWEAINKANFEENVEGEAAKNRAGK